MTTRADHYDLAISGGSFTGLAMACAAAHALGPSARIVIVEKSLASRIGPAQSARAFAISRASSQMLDVLGVWQHIAPDAQAVTNIEITDSSLEDRVRPVCMRYDNTLDDGAPASYIVPDASLASTLRDAVQKSANIKILAPAKIIHTATENTRCQIELDNGQSLSTKLLVAAEGRQSPTRDAAGIKLIQSNYNQTGIVTRISHEKPHNATAVQHFLPAGPFAILPMKNNMSCITWSQETQSAKDIMAGTDASILEHIERRVAGRLGQLALEGPRASWPLSLHLARSYIAPRLALIGDTAHGVHPIAGQGLNLGFRDVAALTEIIADAWRLGLDIGTTTGGDSCLVRYQRWRRFDTTISTAAYDGLNRLFSNDWTLLRAARSAGLGVIDRLAPIKDAFVKEAAGLTGDVPRLLRGEPV